jgi:NAD(P)-dependent dehydrogenase (short-subunit alcohol dehydrogenase family)
VFVNRIAPLLNAPGRIVCLASSGHRFADVDLDDPNFERTPYAEFVAYGRSKTANVLYAVGLDKRLKGRGVRACAVHPGGIQTELGRHLTPAVIQQMQANIEAANRAAGGQGFQWKAIPQGAATSVWAAIVAPADAIGARYCEDCGVAETVERSDAMAGVRPYALDAARADALWAKSEEMVGERFAFA